MRSNKRVLEFLTLLELGPKVVFSNPIQSFLSFSLDVDNVINTVTLALYIHVEEEMEARISVNLAITVVAEAIRYFLGREDYM